jgi:alpha-ketoglutarate-dependent taurine dioxygenase
MQPDCAPITILPDSHALAARVQKDGWLKSTMMETGDNLHAAMERIARSLGNPIPGRAGRMIEPMMPTMKTGANAKSLSVVHGLGSFPMHTDGAHLPQPPRFVVLVCATPGTAPVPTTLLRFRDLRASEQERDLLEAAPFLVRNGRRCFYSTISSRSRPFIRFDEGCMVPQGTEAQASAKLIARRATEVGVTTVYWRSGDVLIIDNWNVLHGRGLAGTQASPDRKLFRVSVQ